jgi:hypothetical protein
MPKNAVEDWTETRHDQLDYLVLERATPALQLFSIMRDDARLRDTIEAYNQNPFRGIRVYLTADGLRVVKAGTAERRAA